MGKKKKSDKRMGWHFLPSSRLLDYDDGRVAKDGETLSIQKYETPKCCHIGMHASPTIAMAASFKKGPVLCRVEVSGDIDEQYDKFAGRSRKIVWSYEFTEADIAALQTKLAPATVLYSFDSIARRLNEVIYNAIGTSSEVQKALLKYVDAQRRKKMRAEKKKERGILAWHFVREDKRLNYNDGRLVEVGKTLSYVGDKPPLTCRRGMHASKKISDAASFGVGPWMCRVRVSGEISTSKNKISGRNREVLWMKRVPKKWVNDILKKRQKGLSEKELVRERAEYLMSSLKESELLLIAARLGWGGK